MYNRPSFIAALDEWANIAEAEKVSKAELAYRWVAYHSKMDATYGDVIIVGASSAKQLKDTVKALGAGPLSEEAVKKIDQIWESIKGDAFLDNFEGTSG
jgi:aflatoxin B1 aldehyde reductase